MKIKQIKIRNFTSLIDIQLSDLPNLVVLIGKNSSGKSNLMDALTLIFLEFGTDLERHLGAADNYQHLFHQNDIRVNPPPEINVSISLMPQEFDFLLGVDEGSWEELESLAGVYLTLTKRVVATAHDVYWNTYEVGFRDNHIVIDIVKDGKVLQSNELAEMLLGEPLADAASWTNEFLGRLAELLRYNIQVIYTSESSRSWPDRFTERPTIIDGGQIRELWELSQSKASQRKPWIEVTRQYEKLAPNEQRPVGIANSVQMQEESSTFPIGVTGEGSQAMFRLIDRLIRSPQIIAIEEPETRLHPALIKKAGRLLAESANTGKQLFISTHSPFLVDRSALDNFFVVKNEGDGTRISSMHSSKLRDLLFDMGVRPSDVLFSDAVLLVEGLSDEVFFDVLSNKMGVPLVGCHVKVIKSNGKSRGKYKIEFWAEVGRDAGIPLYIILDNNAREEAESAIAKGLISPDRLLILAEGDLEDCYPWPALKQALSTLFSREVEEPIPVGERVKRLRNLLSKQEPGNRWKPRLAEEVARIMTKEEAEAEMNAVVGFLRKIYIQVGTDV